MGKSRTRSAVSSGVGDTPPRGREHLMIDAWNVIHAWKHLRPLLDLDLGAAADRLAQEARILHDVEAWVTTLVFDGKGPRLSVHRISADEGFSIVYAPTGVTADAIIEQAVARVSNPCDMIVATRDRALQQSVFAMGARTLSPEDLIDRIEAAHKRQTHVLKMRKTGVDQAFRNGIFDARG